MQGKVRVYRNLTKNCWSIQQGGKVIGHADALWLHGAKFTVQPGGNARVRRERKKFVHAFVDGEFYVMDKPRQVEPEWMPRVRYNPYEMTTFQDSSGTPVHTANTVYMSASGKVFAQ